MRRMISISRLHSSVRLRNNTEIEVLSSFQWRAKEETKELSHPIKPTFRERY